MSRPGFPIAVEARVEANDIVESLTSEELIDFIKQLDESAGDWSVTLKLCEHFAALKIEHDLEEAADARKASGQ